MKNLMIAALIIVAAACSPSKKGEATQEETQKPDLNSQVMAVHDEVMPKMGDLRAVQKKLSAMADSMSMDSVSAASYRDLAARVAAANESMMDWMRNFNRDFQGTDEEVRAYLEGELKKIKKVREEMLGSLKDGQKALGEE